MLDSDSDLSDSGLSTTIDDWRMSGLDSLEFWLGFFKFWLDLFKFRLDSFKFWLV